MKISKIYIFIIVLFGSLKVSAEHQESIKYYSDRFKDIFETVEKSYVEDIDRKKVFEACLNGMMSSLDPHSSFLNEEDLNDLKEQTKGSFGGIGIEVIPEKGVIKVVAPIENLPADRAGVQSEDYIVEVNGEPVNDLGYNKAVKNMRGKPGTKVKIKILTKDGKSKDIELTREIVEIKAIRYHMDDNVGYIKIITFNEHTIDELRKAVKMLMQSSKNNLAGLILDLRNNPGGLLDQAIAVSEYFIDKGVIVSTKGRVGGNNNIFSASSYKQKAPSVPVVVIINSGSASASEIVASALQDHKRAIVIGTESFGKGSVQSVMPIREGALRLTTSRYYRPSGKTIQAVGVTPDIIVEQVKVDYSNNNEEKRHLESKLKNHLKNDSLETETDKEVKKEGKTPIKLSEQYKKDYQYSRAFDLIKGIGLINIKRL